MDVYGDTPECAREKAIVLRKLDDCLEDVECLLASNQLVKVSFLTQGEECRARSTQVHTTLGHNLPFSMFFLSLVTANFMLTAQLISLYPAAESTKSCIPGSRWRAVDSG